MIASQATGDDGKYCFEDLDAGDYKIKFELPSGYEFAPTDGDCDEASDSDAGQGGMTDCITLEEGECNKDVDAGLCEEEKEEGGEGCTPGYWKTKLWRWDETPYSPDMDFDTVFGVDVMDPDLTLWEAITRVAATVKVATATSTSASVARGCCTPEHEPSGR